MENGWLIAGLPIQDGDFAYVSLPEVRLEESEESTFLDSQLEFMFHLVA